jgi:hypothetical protein
MGTPKRTKKNPFGLTYKQDLVIKDVTAKVDRGLKPDIVSSVEKFYDVKNMKVARRVLDANLKSTNFREALVSSLVDKRILGADSKTENVLLAGLDAETKDGSTDYDVRLKYVQEINKIAGMYAVEKKATLNLNMDISEEELDKHIKELQEQLQ